MSGRRNRHTARPTPSCLPRPHHASATHNGQEYALNSLLPAAPSPGSRCHCLPPPIPHRWMNRYIEHAPCGPGLAAQRPSRNWARQPYVWLWVGIFINSGCFNLVSWRGEALPCCQHPFLIPRMLPLPRDTHSSRTPPLWKKESFI